MERELKKLVALCEQKLEELRLTGGLYVEVAAVAEKFKKLKRCKRVTERVIKRFEKIKEILKNCEDKNLEQRIIDCIRLYVKKRLLFAYVGTAQFFAHEDFPEDELPYLILTPKAIDLKEGETLLCKDVDEDKDILYILDKDGIRETRIEIPYLAVYIDQKADSVKTVDEALKHISTVGMILRMKCN